jgi:hypothetical protein
MSTALSIRPPGRPTLLTQYLADVICLALMEGKSLRTICKDETMPNLATVCRWLAKGDDDPVTAEFCKQYARARRVQAELRVDEIFDIADDTSHDDLHTDSGVRANSEWIGRSKIRIEARQWYASKMLPKLYGDKSQLDLTSGGQPMPAAPAHDLSKLGPDDLRLLRDIKRRIQEGGADAGH